MYRLTITQSDPNQPYIVYDAETLKEISHVLEIYKSDIEKVKYFTNYDIIEVNEILVDSYDLEDTDFSDLEKEHV